MAVEFLWLPHWATLEVQTPHAVGEREEQLVITAQFFAYEAYLTLVRAKLRLHAVAETALVCFQLDLDTLPYAGSPAVRCEVWKHLCGEGP